MYVSVGEQLLVDQPDFPNFVGMKRVCEDRYLPRDIQQSFYTSILMNVKYMEFYALIFFALLGSGNYGKCLFEL
jgi:hypothetical protein